MQPEGGPSSSEPRDARDERADERAEDAIARENLAASGSPLGEIPENEAVIEATEPSGFERYLGAGSILLGSAWLTLYSVPLSGKRLARRVASKRPWLEPTIDALR